MRLPLRDDLAGMAPYGAPQLDVPIVLNVNENPYPPSDAVVEDIARAVAHAAHGANRYPDREFSALKHDLATYLKKESGVTVPEDRIWAANGSNEVMLHLLQAFGGPGRTALSFSPTYSMYPEYARNTLTEWMVVERTAEFAIDMAAAARAIRAAQPAAILLASPNNPTGTAVPLEQTAELARLAAGGGPDGMDALVVVDEAYGEFRRSGTASALTLQNEFPHVVVTRTMSKAFGMAGLRLGYLVADPQVIDALRIVRLPYHLSAITQAAASAALAHADELMAQVSQLRHERDDLVRWLAAKGYHPVPSDANFVLFGPVPDRHAVWEALLQRGILIREVGPPGYLRVSVGTPAEMAEFRAVLEEVS